MTSSFGWLVLFERYREGGEVVTNIGIGGHTIGFRTSGLPKAGDGVPVDSSILAFDDFLGQYMSRVTTAGEKFGGNVLEVTKILEEAFSFLKELLIKAYLVELLLRRSGRRGLQLIKGRYNLIVAFSPTGWTFGKGKKKSPERKWQQDTILSTREMNGFTIYSCIGLTPETRFKGKW